MQVITIQNAYTGEWFFAEHHCDYGLGENWVPCTSDLPCFVTPRPGIEDGRVDTVAKYMKVFFSGPNNKQIDPPSCKKACIRNKTGKCRVVQSKYQTMSQLEIAETLVEMADKYGDGATPLEKKQLESIRLSSQK